MESSGFKALQTVIAIAAFPLAIWPLVQFALGNEQNRIFRTIFGDPTGAARWMIPAAILVIGFIIVVVLDELAKRAESQDTNS